MNSIHQSHCIHCGATWQTGCVIKSICRVCQANGHTDGFGKCPKCSPPKKDDDNNAPLVTLKKPLPKAA